MKRSSNRPIEVLLRRLFIEYTIVLDIQINQCYEVDGVMKGYATITLPSADEVSALFVSKTEYSDEIPAFPATTSTPITISLATSDIEIICCSALSPVALN